jgi:hypothetical protein
MLLEKKTSLEKKGSLAGFRRRENAVRNVSHAQISRPCADS